MSIARVVCLAPAVDAVRAEMRRVRFKETGGPLVGYAIGDTLTVTAAGGPGPRAQLSALYVKIDGAAAAGFCAAEYKKTRGASDYIGDWHCHLSCVIRPSDLDLGAMAEMAEWEGSPTRNPISLIWCKWKLRICRAFIYEEGRLRAIPLELR